MNKKTTRTCRGPRGFPCATVGDLCNLSLEAIRDDALCMQFSVGQMIRMVGEVGSARIVAVQPSVLIKLSQAPDVDIVSLYEDNAMSLQGFKGD